MLRGLLHETVLRTRNAPGLRSAYRGVYSAAASCSARALGAVPGVRSVFLHRGMSREGWEPGVSDIDLVLLLESGADEPALLAEVEGRLRWLKTALPMLGDLWLCTEEELGEYLRWGGMRAWEDAPDWARLRGRRLPAVKALAESPEKKRWLDPWVWTFVCHMEVSRRFLRPGGEPREKLLADMRKLLLDVARYSDSIEGGGVEPASRADAGRRMPEVASLDAKRVWLESSARLQRASRRTLQAVGSGSTAGLRFPAPDPGREDLLARLLESSPGVRCAVSDPPYHTYILLGEDAAPDDYLRAAEAFLRASAVEGVPMVLGPSAWSLCLQSSYLGAPLGWLGWRAERAGAERIREMRQRERWGAGRDLSDQGLFRGWGLSALGDPGGRIRLLPERLRWEVAAEAATWMALWWRYLWIHPGYGSRFALFHLYTRALGLRLALEGAETGPWSDWQGLLRRSREDSDLLESLERFVREEPASFVDAAPRSCFAPEHVEALNALFGSMRENLLKGPVPCPVR